ncbi:MAG: SNF2-related protein [Faecalibacterium sp.]
MFKDLLLKATYSSYEEDIASTFYAPALAQCVRYDRASAYFSAKSLASYSKGLEVFARNGNHFRLIVSSELSKSDYDEIQQGYQLREETEQLLLRQLQEELSLEEERNISNLAYLISLGIIDIKIAFTKEGIFHDKFGVMIDGNQDIICFRGSNNETEAALYKNYEAFDITCSWQASEFDYAKITKSQEIFEKLWNNQSPNIRVCDLSEVLRKELVSHDKGKIIVDPAHLEPDCLLLDYDGRLTLDIKLEPKFFFNNSVYKLRLKKFVDVSTLTDSFVQFKSELTYPKFKTIITYLEQDSKKRNYRFFVTKRVLDYIKERELHIRERSNLGLSIKQQEDILLPQFEAYKLAVNNAFARPLREKQMWDSFFMCTMKKSSNFSVPGSGKTASVLGVFAYLQSIGSVKRIVMVGPKNSFGSWQDEFCACFGEKQALRLFNLHDSAYHNSTMEKKRALLYDTGNKNLLLLNYESVGTYLDELKNIMTDETLLVFDEVHKVKAIGGKRATDALELSRNASYTIALTGTPIPNTYCDIHNLLDILYHDEYNDFFGFTLSQLKQPSDYDVTQINDKLQPFFCRTSKQELSVPDANPDSFVSAKASADENKLFHILAMKYRKNKLALIIRLLQLASNPYMLLNAIDLSEFSDVLDVSGDVDEIDYADFSEEVEHLIKGMGTSAKFNACIRVATQLQMEQKPAVIWCIFKDSIHHIAAELESRGARVGCIYGDVEMDERQLILSDFKAGKLDFLITNPHTLAESVSLHSICHDAIYFEYSYNLVHLLQSKDRIHRLGLPSEQYTQYFFMQQIFQTNEGELYSLDEQIYLRLKEKEDVMLAAIEGGTLESGCTVQEDLDIIFAELKLFKKI